MITSFVTPSTFLSTVHADQDPRGLLLLRVRPPRQPPPTRVQLRQHGPIHDRGHQVRDQIFGLQGRENVISRSAVQVSNSTL